jgi:hypothetical protein
MVQKTLHYAHSMFKRRGETFNDIALSMEIGNFVGRGGVFGPFFHAFKFTCMPQGNFPRDRMCF